MSQLAPAIVKSEKVGAGDREAVKHDMCMTQVPKACRAYAARQVCNMLTTREQTLAHLLALGSFWPALLEKVDVWQTHDWLTLSRCITS